MKTIKIIILALLPLISSFHLQAQTNTLRVKTSAICKQCKEIIENDLSFEKGVKSCHLDMDTKIVTVVYNPKKTDEQKIREAITKIGYDADTLKAEPKAYDKLPKCCKREVKEQ